MKDYNGSHRCPPGCKNHSCGDNAALGVAPPPLPPLPPHGISVPASTSSETTKRSTSLSSERTDSSPVLTSAHHCAVSGSAQDAESVPRVCMQTLFCFRLWLRRVHLAKCRSGKTLQLFKATCFLVHRTPTYTQVANTLRRWPSFALIFR